MKGKPCPYCRNSFTPDPRVGQRQKTCGDPSCQKALKVKNNLRWREANPDYYRHDYPRVRRWLDQHQGYLKQYRRDHPEYVQRDREAKRLRYRQRKLCGDIQAEISLQPLGITFLLSSFPCLDIQAPMDSKVCPRDNELIESRR